MVAIPDREDPTLQAMFRKMEDTQSMEKRTYIGASLIGHDCQRHIWYAYRGAEGIPIGAKGLAAIEDGHRTEELVISRLRAVEGVEIWNRDAQGKPYGFSDGVFAGNVDGVVRGLLQAPMTVHILEIKACNETKFNKLNKFKSELGEKNALAEWDYTYWCQAQTYMRKLEIDRHYLVVATPGGRDVTSCRTELDADIADNLEKKANRIAKMKDPPERIGNADWYQCRYCRYREVCHS